MREAEAQGIRCVYRLLDLAVLKLGPEALPDLLSQAERLGYDGLNITHPCKTLVLEHLTDIAPEAAAIGAVNTVLLRGGKRIGHNTDVTGFSAGFSRALADAPRRRVVLFGAGGAGAAVAHAALGLSIGTLHIVDVEPGRAESLAAALSARFGAGRALAATEAADAVAAADGIINATPVGMAAYPGLPCRKACSARTSGSPRSSTSRLKPRCSRRRAPLAAERSTAAAWRFSRPSTPSGSSAAANPIRRACGTPSRR